MLFSCEVGKDFSFGFFKKNSNCCYDKETGILYSNDIKNFEKLNIHTEDIKQCENKKERENLNLQQINILIENKLLQKEKEFSKKIEELKNTSIKQQKEIIKSENTITVLKSLIEEITEIITENEKQQDLIIEKDKNIDTLKNSIGILNKKNKNALELIHNLENKFEALIDIMTERKTEQLPTFSSLSNMNLQKIWSVVKDKNTAVLLSLMLMGKKMLEEKGMRL